MDATVVREARVEDAAGMGTLMVTTWLTAHRSHIPLHAWEKRRDEWTADVSARGWERCLRERDAAPEGVTLACYLVAEEEGLLVGLAAAAAAGGDRSGLVAEVGSLYVHPDHQGRGIGRRLVARTAARLLQLAFTSLHIGVAEANLEARGFYEALGGRHIEDRDFHEDVGVVIPERVYAWPDLRSLLSG